MQTLHGCQDVKYFWLDVPISSKVLHFPFTNSNQIYRQRFFILFISMLRKNIVLQGSDEHNNFKVETSFRCDKQHGFIRYVENVVLTNIYIYHHLYLPILWQVWHFLHIWWRHVVCPGQSLSALENYSVIQNLGGLHSSFIYRCKQNEKPSSTYLMCWYATLHMACG